MRDAHFRRLREKNESRPDVPRYVGTVRGTRDRFLASDEPRARLT
jgi:DNA-binding response OmpR family regulator